MVACSNIYRQCGHSGQSIAPRITAPSYINRSRLSSLHRRPYQLQLKLQHNLHTTSTPKQQLSTMTWNLYTDETPADVKDAKGLFLITQNTPNGQATQIVLEELKDLYGTEWHTKLINIGTNEQKKDWFLRLNPNGRIPTLVDNSASPPFPVIETAAQMLYLVKKYDKNDTLGFKDEFERNECLQWTFFWHGGGAPYQGQVNHFLRAAPEKIEYAINRYKNETLRVFGVLEIQLSGRYREDGQPREYLAGNGKGKYSLADIKSWCWVKGWERTGFTREEMAEFPNLLKWIDRIAERPAVQRGIGDAYSQQ